VAVRETLPDSVFESADEIELIDLPPDDLLARLKADGVPDSAVETTNVAVYPNRTYDPKTGKSARGVVRDYGPEAWTGRQLDISKQLAAELGMISTGVETLDVQVVGRI